MKRPDSHRPSTRRALRRAVAVTAATTVGLLAVGASLTGCMSPAPDVDTAIHGPAGAGVVGGGAATSTTTGVGDANGGGAASAASTASAAPGTPVNDTGPLDIGIADAVFTSLSRNRGLALERFEPAIARTREEEARAEFDPTLTASASKERQVSQRLARSGSGIESTIVDTNNASVGVEQRFATGTTVEATLTGTDTDSSLYNNHLGTGRVGVTVTQSLLQGFGRTVNLASIRQARIGTEISRYQLRGYAEALVANIELTYWDTVQAQREIAIYEDSLNLARQQLRETQESIQLGRLSEIELAAGDAEVAQREEDLINARSRFDTLRLNLVRLLNIPGTTRWDRELRLLDAPVAPVDALAPVTDHVALARSHRPDLNEARLQLDSNELEVVRTRNGLLPKLDFFVTLGDTGYADSFDEGLRRNLGDGYDYEVGVQLEIPLGNRSAKAAHERANLTRDQSREAIDNLVDLIELDVRSAWIEADRSRRQIAATAATRRHQEATYKAEVDKFHVGRSTNLLVAQAQRDLLRSRLDEQAAVVNALKAEIDLARLDGTLLARRGITAPGAD